MNKPCEACHGSGLVFADETGKGERMNEMKNALEIIWSLIKVFGILWGLGWLVAEAVRLFA